MRKRPGAIFQVEARNAERLDGRRDLARDRFRRADIERTVLDLPSELLGRHRRPAALAADPITHALVIGVQLFARLLVAVRDVAGGVYADLPRGLAQLRIGAKVEIDIGPEPLRIAADDGEHQRQIVAHSADDGFRAAADAD